MWKTYENMKTPTFWMDKYHFPNGNHGGLQSFFAFQVKDNLRSRPSQSQAFQVSDSKGKHVENGWFLASNFLAPEKRGNGMKCSRYV